ncbi:MAG: hypothetical protein V1907_01255 [Candidatus Kerfeldbacteria bacterium]
MKAQNIAPGSPAEPREAVVYAELLSKAHEEGLKSIQTELLTTPSDQNGHLAIVKAVVEVERGHFEGLGDADPGSVEDFLAPHLIRVAETRAKARALRDAVNVGVVSFEELDGVSLDRDSSPGSGAPPASRSPRHVKTPTPARPRGNGNGAPKSAPRSGNGSEPMSEAQRRYLFRLMAGQGYQREAAEERLKDLFQVGSLSEVTKPAATAMIDRLLNPAPQGAGRGATPDF